MSLNLEMKRKWIVQRTPAAKIAQGARALEDTKDLCINNLGNGRLLTV
jgi:hypothetical protein